MILFFGAARADDADTRAATVEFVNRTLNRVLEACGIPASQRFPSGANTRIANMEYLLCLVDRANERLNGEPTTNYCESEYATAQVANVAVVRDAADRLVRVEPNFWMHLSGVEAGDVFSFQFSASGCIGIDWGDGMNILRWGNGSHTYTQDGDFVIAIGGRITAYGMGSWGSAPPIALSFGNSPIKAKVTKLEGDLGRVFPIVAWSPGTTAPRFSDLFRGFTGLTEIPETLFAGLQGVGGHSMFSGAFADTNITSIPENLFAGITGPGPSMFMETFRNTKITSIPEGLFATIKGAPGNHMFWGTFADNPQLTSIPDNLFDNVTRQPQIQAFGSTASTFEGTFRNTGITSIPENLFAFPNREEPIRPAPSLFLDTFRNTKITSIPENMFSGVTGAPAQSTFFGTFRDNPNLTGIIPGGLFAGIQGRPASNSFVDTFRNNPGLTGIGDGLFDGIHGNQVGDGSPFDSTFRDCTGLTGPSARTLIDPDNPALGRQFIWEKWPDIGGWRGNRVYMNAIGLDDYDIMPDGWKY